MHNLHHVSMSIVHLLSLLILVVTLVILLVVVTLTNHSKISMLKLYEKLVII